MRRMIAYRGFEIHVELTPSADDTFDVTFQIRGGTNLEVLGAQGGRILLRNGPFTERWAYVGARRFGSNNQACTRSMCASALLLASTAVFAQASGAVGASGPMGMKDSAMTSDLMASGAMGVKQHRGKHAKGRGMSAEPAASGEKGK